MNNSEYFFIGSYTNNFQIGEFLTNSDTRLSHSPKFALNVLWADDQLLICVADTLSPSRLN